MEEIFDFFSNKIGLTAVEGILGGMLLRDFLQNTRLYRKLKNLEELFSSKNRVTPLEVADDFIEYSFDRSYKELLKFCETIKSDKLKDQENRPERDKTAKTRFVNIAQKEWKILNRRGSKLFSEGKNYSDFLKSYEKRWFQVCEYTFKNLLQYWNDQENEFGDVSKYLYDRRDEATQDAKEFFKSGKIFEIQKDVIEQR